MAPYKQLQEVVDNLKKAHAALRELSHEQNRLLVLPMSVSQMVWHCSRLVLTISSRVRVRDMQYLYLLTAVLFCMSTCQVLAEVVCITDADQWFDGFQTLYMTL